MYGQSSTHCGEYTTDFPMLLSLRDTLVSHTTHRFLVKICLLTLLVGGNQSVHGQSALAKNQSDATNLSSRIKPKALKPGDTIAIVAPAGPVDIEKVKAFVTQAEQVGYRVKMSASIDRKTGYLAGTDDQRADELNSAIRDPQVRAIFPARGGYGLTRILDRIDYAALAKDPKIVTGYSDLTALHLAIARKVGLITFHSPMPTSDLWKGQAPEVSYAGQLFWRMVEASRYSSDQTGFEVPYPPDSRPAALSKGKARGRLIGGNLTLITATMATPFAIETDHAILFIEDIEEAPYRVDRMLSQMRLAGLLDKVAGVIIGDFSYKNGTEQAQMEAVFHGYFDRANYPVVWKFPVGHVANNATLPQGVLAELDAETLTLRLLENPLKLD